jgi:hypothetical protein
MQAFDDYQSPEYIHTYRITPLSLWNAASAGLSAQAILQGLERYSKYPLPGNVQVDIYQRNAAEIFYAGGAAHGGSGVIVLPCGAGKTMVGMAAMEQMQCNTLILCPSTVAVRQWIDELPVQRARLGPHHLRRSAPATRARLSHHRRTPGPPPPGAGTPQGQGRYAHRRDSENLLHEPAMRFLRIAQHSNGEASALATCYRHTSRCTAARSAWAKRSGPTNSARALNTSGCSCHNHATRSSKPGNTAER